MDSGLAIAAIVISVLSAVSATWVTIRVARSGFRVSENLLSDLATLLAALRSIATTGAIAMGEQRTTPISIDTDLQAVRNFVSSTSGLALSLYAGEVGSAGAPDDARAGAWRILRFHFVNLGAMTVDSSSDNQRAARIALNIELTLSYLDKGAIRSVRRQIRNLPEVLSSIEKSQNDDVLLRALLAVAKNDDGPNKLQSRSSEFQRLQQLKDSGLEDPDIDMFLAVERGDEGIAELKDALDRGANPSITLGEVLSKYEAR